MDQTDTEVGKLNELSIYLEAHSANIRGLSQKSPEDLLQCLDEHAKQRLVIGSCAVVAISADTDFKNLPNRQALAALKILNQEAINLFDTGYCPESILKLRNNIQSDPDALGAPSLVAVHDHLCRVTAETVGNLVRMGINPLAQIETPTQAHKLILQKFFPLFPSPSDHS